MATGRSAAGSLALSCPRGRRQSRMPTGPDSGCPQELGFLAEHGSSAGSAAAEGAADTALGTAAGVPSPWPSEGQLTLGASPSPCTSSTSTGEKAAVAHPVRTATHRGLPKTLWQSRCRWGDRVGLGQGSMGSTCQGKAGTGQGGERRVDTLLPGSGRARPPPLSEPEDQRPRHGLSPACPPCWESLPVDSRPPAQLLSFISH